MISNFAPSCSIQVSSHSQKSRCSADLSSEMRFLDRDYLRVVLLNAKQNLIKVVTVSQGSVNESLAHPREVFKPAIVHSTYSSIMVHNHPSGAMPYSVLCRSEHGVLSKRAWSNVA
jgi:DNA repair protein RadC